LKALGGKPCSAKSEFICVKISVPLDHFDATNTQRIKVAFAVRPADGVSKGLYVTATGGPGSSGIANADSYAGSFARGVLDRFDVVFFDQRGMGRSGNIDCPTAMAAYQTSTSSNPATTTGTFTNACTHEAHSRALLPFMGTDQATEDLESFRVALGSPSIWLYGESYGTQYGQIYAAAHPASLKALIVDGVVDLTLTGPQFWTSASQAFERVLNTTLTICDHRTRCLKDATTSAGAVYDALEARLTVHPINVRFPLANGDRVVRQLTLGLFQTTTSGQMYGTYGRMMFLRALTAAGQGDLVPMLRLAYNNAMLNPQNLKPIIDPTWSDAGYYGVDCRDYAYFSGTQDQRSNSFLSEAAKVDAANPRIGGAIFLSDYPCVWWPDSTVATSRPAPLVNTGVPTFVIVATSDPITPVAQGRAVYSRLADGYLITTIGGPHVTFGRGNPCPDNLVNDFLISGRRPTQRTTRCPGAYVQPYIPLAPTKASTFANLKAALVSFDRQFAAIPEYTYWDASSPLATGCAVTGSVRVRATTRGEAYTFTNCSFTRGVRITGTGLKTSSGATTLTITTTGRWHQHLRYVNGRHSTTVTFVD
jgi:pimeloyl-ACP methyl ester carboxylesterase